MIKDRETLECIFTLVKRVKKPLIKIYPDGRVIGTDEQFTSLNILEYDDIRYNIDIPYVIKTTEITPFMRELSKSEEYEFTFTPYEVTMRCKYTIKEKDRETIVRGFEFLFNHMELSFQFDELYNKAAHTMSYPILYTAEEFQKTNPKMFFLKASDGAMMFGVDNRFLMSSFNSIHPANKTDKVTLIIRDYDIYSYTAEFIIYKKKDNYQLHEFLRFRKL
jgi:hypothetical protein